MTKGTFQYNGLSDSTTPLNPYSHMPGVVAIAGVLCLAAAIYFDASPAACTCLLCLVFACKWTYELVSERREQVSQTGADGLVVDFYDKDLSISWSGGTLDWEFGTPYPSLTGSGVDIQDGGGKTKTITLTREGRKILEMPYTYREKSGKDEKSPKRDKDKKRFRSKQ